MKTYIGTKLVKAEPQVQGDRAGYFIVYPDGYKSWSPADVFERAYMPLQRDNPPSITEDVVTDFIVKKTVTTMGDRTTVVQARLANGYILTESSSCVDPRNYDPSIGEDICVQRIRSRVWELLGFLLCTAANGV